MNAVSLYVSTCRLVLQASTNDAETWSELGRLLPQLRKALSCNVCSQLVTDPMRSVERLCSHRICKECLSSRDESRSTCDLCTEQRQFTEDKQFRTLLLCFRKLCEFVVAGAPYPKLNPTTEGSGLADLLLDCVGVRDEFLSGGATEYGENGNSVFVDDCNATQVGLPASTNGEASLYSVFANDHRTKITIKRKPGDSSSSSDFSDTPPTAVEKTSFKKLKAAESSKAKLSRNRLSLRKGCRCGNATLNPGKLTCCGQRCPCYVSAKSCDDCRCKGCRNPHKLHLEQTHNHPTVVEVETTVTVVSEDRVMDPGSDVDILL